MKMIFIEANQSSYLKWTHYYVTTTEDVGQDHNIHRNMGKIKLGDRLRFLKISAVFWDPRKIWK